MVEFIRKPESNFKGAAIRENFAVSGTAAVAASFFLILNLKYSLINLIFHDGVLGFWGQDSLSTSTLAYARGSEFLMQTSSHPCR